MRTLRNKLNRAKERLARLENKHHTRQNDRLWKRKDIAKNRQKSRRNSDLTLMSQIHSTKTLITQLEVDIEQENVTKEFREKVKGLGAWLDIES